MLTDDGDLRQPCLLMPEGPAPALPVGAFGRGDIGDTQGGMVVRDSTAKPGEGLEDEWGGSASARLK